MLTATQEKQVVKARTKYRDKMLQIAFVVSGWSREPEGQRHGCVLALDGEYVVATGFNGPDRDWGGQHDCGGTCCRAPLVHAEVNAIINARLIGVRLDQCMAYVTKKPCRPCLEALQEAGVFAVFWLQESGWPGCAWTL